MGALAWIVLLGISAAVATAAQFLLFPKNRKATDYDWVYIAGGSLLGGFTGQAWYVVGPVFEGLNVLPALAGVAVGAVLAEGIYRLILRPRQRS